MSRFDLSKLAVVYFFLVAVKPAFSCHVIVDWDNTANCGVSSVTPCRGFCSALKAAINYCRATNPPSKGSGSGSVLVCDGSRRPINQQDWRRIIARCRTADPSFPNVTVSPQGQNGCPRIIGCLTIGCRLQRACELGSATVIDNDCPPSGTYTCSDGHTILCIRPNDYRGDDRRTIEPPPTGAPDYLTCPAYGGESAGGGIL